SGAEGTPRPESPPEKTGWTNLQSARHRAVPPTGPGPPWAPADNSDDRPRRTLPAASPGPRTTWASNVRPPTKKESIEGNTGTEADRRWASGSRPHSTQ